MQTTEKPKGLAKIWREIKRPFRQLRQCVRQFVRDMVGYQDLSKEIHSFRSEFHKDLTGLIQRSISTAILHQKTFSRFKNIHQGQEIVLVATGPTAKDYMRIDNAIHIGVNRAFQIENIDLHYLFMQDYNVKYYIKEANRYQPDSCSKFYGMIEKWNIIIPDNDVIEANALRYRTDIDFIRQHFDECRFRCSIDSEPLGDFGSVVFSAMQFALWTNPRTIYLVGCDCSKGYFDGQTSDGSASHLVSHWFQLKEFARLYYPETEIISIHPVGLKGIFTEKKEAS